MTQTDIKFERLRLSMTALQLRDHGIHDEQVLAVMERIPRHIFVGERHRNKAYEDKPVSIPCGQTISQPYMVALMTQLLELREDSIVLEIGTGTGYQSAILGSLAHSVISIERHKTLAALAQKLLKSISIDNVIVRHGDGTLGAPDDGPFDAIMVTAGGPEIPKILMSQLAIGGRMVCPIGNRKKQELVIVTRSRDGFDKTKNTRCRFVPLIGQEGWDE